MNYTQNFKMKKNKIRIILFSVILLIVIGFIGVFIAPNYRIIRIHNVFSGYTYIVYSDHAEIEKYDIKNSKKVIEIPNTILGRPVTKIGRMAFEFSDNLIEVKISNNIEIIDDIAFANCPNLTKVKFGSNVKEVRRGVFDNCKKLNEVILNEGLEKIEKAAFKRDIALETITIPKSVAVIEESAFENTGLVNVIYCPK